MDRAAMLRQIEAGELASLEIRAGVFTQGPNRNFVRFKDQDLETFAASFEGQPFLRDHDQNHIESRDGTIAESFMAGAKMHQVINLTTRRGMIAYVEGQIDRFSIGWTASQIQCTVCEQDWLSCSHWPGRTYSGKLCELLMIEPKGKETSAVNTPASPNTGLLAELLPLKMKKKGFAMFPETAPTTADETAEAVSRLTGATEAAEAVKAQAAQANAVLLSMCAGLLKSGLAASGLPATAQAQIKTRFQTRLDAGEPFEPTELDGAIAEMRGIVAEAAASSLVAGPSRISAMATTDDMLRAAVSDMFRVERDPGLEKITPARLSGIRELYLLLTGDYDLHGGYYAERMQLATTADFAGLVKNALNKAVANQWDRLGREGYDWWNSIVQVEHFTSLNDITGILVGTVGLLPTVAEQGEYTELAVGDSPEVASFVKKGGYVPLTLELIDRDETAKLRAYPRELANAGLRTLSSRIADVFTQASGTGPTMADTGVLFNSTAVTTAGGHANLLTTALSATQWDVVAAAVYNQPMLIKQAASYYGTGPKMAVEPRYCLIPRALRKTARDAFINAWDVTDNKHAENLLKGEVVPLVVPEWTDATDWAAVCDPAIAPGIVVGERFGIMPEIYVAGRETDPAVFMNDEHRIKVRMFNAILVQDFRPLHKSNVAG
jgi:hypothetical protein